MDRSTEERSATGGDASRSGHRTHRHHHHHHRRSGQGRSRTMADPFAPVERELLDFTEGSGPAVAGDTPAGMGGSRGQGALPPALGGDPRRRERPRRADTGTSSSSSSSTTTSPSRTHSQALDRSPIRRQRDGTIALVDRRATHPRGRSRSGAGEGDRRGERRHRQHPHRTHTRDDTEQQQQQQRWRGGRPAGHPPSDGEGSGGDGYDYDPDNVHALGEKAALLSDALASGDAGSDGGLVRLPCAFLRAPIPYWVRRVSDLLLFHNGNGGIAAAGLLPVDAALLQLEADLREARALLRAVESGKDGGLLRARPARDFEVYGPAEGDVEGGREVRGADGGAVGQPHDEGLPFEKELRPMLEGGGRAGPADSSTTAAAGAGADGTVVVPVRDTLEATRAPDETAALVPPLRREGPPPWMDPAAEAEDEARPLLQREIPLWRRRGAAARTLRDLVELLESRIRLLQRKLTDPHHGAWFEAVGAPNSSGVDGTQRTTLPPALEQAYTTTVTNTILSDLFHRLDDGGLRERAARLSTAFTAQAPKVHDVFLIEEDFRPLYDDLLARRGDTGEPSSASPALGSGVTATATVAAAAAVGKEEVRRSFTVHVDYIRLHPPPAQGLLLSGGDDHGAAARALGVAQGLDLGEWGTATEGTFSRLLTDTQYYSALLSGDVLEDTLMMANTVASTLAQTHHPHEQQHEPHTHRKGRDGGSRPRRASVDTLVFDTAAAAALSLLSVATTQKNALVTFPPEAYLVATLLQHYERYRLLTLNLLPHLKSRAFYEEQLAHLSRQPTRAPDMEALRGQVQMLRDKAADMERAALTAMIALWRAVLHLRGQTASTDSGGSGVPFVVASHRAARPSPAAAPAAPTNRGDGTGGAHGVSATSELLGMATTAPEGGAQRRHVRELEIAEMDSSAAPSAEVERSGTAAGTTTTPDSSDTLRSTPGSLFAATGQAHALSGAYGATRSSDPGAADSVLLGGAAAAAAAGVSPSLTSERHGVELVRSATRARAVRFFLRRVGHAAETPYVEGDDVLLYEPVLEGADALPPPVATPAAPLPTTAPRAHLDRLQFFQVAVFARANAVVPPQYVGCTLPRPLSAANVAFFNESFEIRVLHEPEEVILHLLCVSDGPGKGTVVATVRLQPTLTRSYLLLPLQAPVSFVFRKRLMARYPGAALSGVLSASTTWTTVQGLTVAQMERLFLSGAADPLNPEYAPLLRMLKNYYMDVERNARDRPEGQRGRRRALHGSHGDDEVAFPPAGPERRHTRSTQRRSLSTMKARSMATHVEASPALAVPASAPHARRRHRRSFAPQALREVPLVTGTDTSAAAAGPAPALSERLLLLRHRWLIARGLAKPLDPVEADLLHYPVPLTESEQYDVLRRVRRGLARAAAARRQALIAEGGEAAVVAAAEDPHESAAPGAGARDPFFDEKTYNAAPASSAGLALSPLPRELKLRLWQDRQRHMKLMRKPVRHVTDEERLGQVVTVPTLSMKLVFDLTPRSQLNPRRIARPKNEDIDRDVLNRRRDSRIVVHVMKANNLPARADGSPLEPFVQATFVYENAYSRCEVGTSPAWFQTLELPFQPLDFDEDTLSMIDDDIVISVYDKVEIAMAPATVTTGAVAHETHFRTERRLLGVLRLPFYSLHQAAEARMEGVFPVQTPRWILGYDVASAALADVASNPLGEDPTRAAASDRSVSTSATIHIYVSLWPPLQREKSTSITFQELTTLVRHLNTSAELRYLHEVALKWQKLATSKLRAISRLNAKATTREVEPFVNCSTGDLTLVCRYLLPHGGPPPPGTVTNIFEAIRYVSLLPFVVDIMTWGDKDVWSTNVELLAMRNGDYEELALLLVHFLRYLAPHGASYIVVGAGDIFAQTIMVLHAFEGSQWRLIDPRTGWITPVERPFGSILRDVHYVVSHDQLWANIQLSGLPHRMTWDLEDPAYWLPCFDTRRDPRLARCMSALTSIQREVLTYQPVDPLKVKEIEVDLRAALKQALLAWRNHRPPVYHRGVEAILRELLVMAEDERCACGTVRHPAVTATARERLAEYFGMSVDGFALAEAPPARTRRKGRARRGGRRREHHRDGDTVEPVVVAVDADEDGRGEPSASAAAGATASRSAVSGGRRLRPCLTLVGAPVTSSYNSADRRYYNILQQVFACAVHEVGTDDVSFAAGVYVKGYTGDVYAMWVFLVAICRGVEEVPGSDSDGGADGDDDAVAGGAAEQT